jgi:hypothetical protein
MASTGCDGARRLLVGHARLRPHARIVATDLASPPRGQGPGRGGFRAFFTELIAAVSDADIESAHMVADDEHVAIVYTLTGTHDGDFNGRANRQEDRGPRRSDRPLPGRQDRRAVG